jgi:predicted DNA-binding transcriptional regulator AlpA
MGGNATIENEMKGRLLKRVEAAQFLGLKEQTLANLAWKNQGPPFIRLSARCIRYSVDDLLAWTKSHEVRPEAEQAV